MREGDSGGSHGGPSRIQTGGGARGKRCSAARVHVPGVRASACSRVWCVRMCAQGRACTRVFVTWKLPSRPGFGTLDSSRGLGTVCVSTRSLQDARGHVLPRLSHPGPVLHLVCRRESSLQMAQRDVLNPTILSFHRWVNGGRNMACSRVEVTEGPEVALGLMSPPARPLGGWQSARGNRGSSEGGAGKAEGGTRPAASITAPLSPTALT